MTDRKKRTIKLDGTSVPLPPEVLKALELEPGATVAWFLDTRKKQFRIERHVEDPWGDALRKKEGPGFEDLLGQQKKRDDAAERLFEDRLKTPPPE